MYSTPSNCTGNPKCFRAYCTGDNSGQVKDTHDTEHHMTGGLFIYGTKREIGKWISQVYFTEFIIGAFGDYRVSGHVCFFVC